MSAPFRTGLRHIVSRALAKCDSGGRCAAEDGARVAADAGPRRREEEALEPQPGTGEIDLGAVVWQAPPGPVNRSFLHEELFDTSLEESNLVGNI
jgi:hypothetical protein